MVCQKERHADPMLAVLQINKPVATNGALLTGTNTYEGAMAVVLELLSQSEFEGHVCILSTINGHVNKIAK